MVVYCSLVKGPQYMKDRSCLGGAKIKGGARVKGESRGGANIKGGG